MKITNLDTGDTWNFNGQNYAAALTNTKARLTEKLPAGTRIALVNVQIGDRTEMLTLRSNDLP